MEALATLSANTGSIALVALLLVGSFPSCMSDPSPLSNFELNCNWLLFCLIPLVCICFFLLCHYILRMYRRQLSTYTSSSTHAVRRWLFWLLYRIHRHRVGQTLCLSWKFWFLCFRRVEKPYRSEYSDGVSYLVDAQLRIHLGSSVCADVTSQV